MKILYHFWLSPESRAIRILLSEKSIPFETKIEFPWEQKEAFLTLNPAGTLPVLVETNGTALSGVNAISEFLNEQYPDPDLMGPEPFQRAEIRRLGHWFNDKFSQEVTSPLTSQKVKKYFISQPPNTQALRSGYANVHYHLDYMTYLTERRTWIAGNYFSLADITAAAHISVVDYLGGIPWSQYDSVYNWYIKIKSRPSMRSLLADRIPGLPAASHYEHLDF